MALDGNVIKERLEEIFNGESQQTVADKLNMTQGSISKLLTGKQVPTLETLYHIANIYGVSVDWIIGLSERRETSKVTEFETASYSDVVEALTQLVYIDGAEILDDESSEFILRINDPLAKALLKKSIMLVKMDMELYKNWNYNKLPLFDDRELIEEMIWDDGTISVQARENLSETAWLQVHDKARARRAEYMWLFK